MYKSKFTVTSTENHTSNIAISPLDKGFGDTLGTALRRTLFNHTKALGIIAVRVKNISHEFCSIPGVDIDMQHLILKLQTIIFTGQSENTITARLKTNKKGCIYAGDIQDLPNNINILNPTLALATLTGESSFELELDIVSGTGLRPQQNRETLPVNSIALTCDFSPIEAVTFSTTVHKSGHDSYEALNLRITSNGAIEPEEAFTQALHYISQTALTILDTNHSAENTEEETAVHTTAEETQLKELLHMPLMDAIPDFSLRAKKVFHTLNIQYIGDLVQMTEQDFRNIHSCGEKTITEISRRLAEETSLTINMNVDHLYTKPSE